MTSLIMTFDMNAEVFGEIMLPECLLREHPMNMNTLVAGDLLYVMQCDRVRLSCRCVWVMKEYGVASSWCKLGNLKDLSLGRALDVMSTGEIIFGYYTPAELVIYHPLSAGWKFISITHHASLGSIYVHSYRESFALFLEGDEISEDTQTDTEVNSTGEKFSWARVVYLYEEHTRINAIKFLNDMLY